MERRELIQWLAATAGLKALESLAPPELLALGHDIHRGARRGRALTAHALNTVTAAAERIIPATETPGATDANVAGFIDKMLADWLTPDEREEFLGGLAELDRRSRARAGEEFVACSERDQIAILTALDDETRAHQPGEHWFARLKYLTVYGYCTSEPGMRALRLVPLPNRYDGCAPVDAAR